MWLAKLGKECCLRLSRRFWGGIKNELPYKLLRGRLRCSPLGTLRAERPQRRRARRNGCFCMLTQVLGWQNTRKIKEISLWWPILSKTWKKRDARAKLLFRYSKAPGVYMEKRCPGKEGHPRRWEKCWPGWWSQRASYLNGVKLVETLRSRLGHLTTSFPGFSPILPTERERERDPGLSLTRSVGRVEKNPGNEVGHLTANGNTQFPVSGFTLSVYPYLENYDSRSCSSRLPCLFLFIRSLLFKQRNRLQRYVSLKYSSIFN